ncbi:Uncharacterised protein [Candidatus Ornithobacterium hominis]|nr:Uncharacterised protein [Candidatus Ornithobacterium hominis]
MGIIQVKGQKSNKDYFLSGTFNAANKNKTTSIITKLIL